jgi:predicted ATPase
MVKGVTRGKTLPDEVLQQLAAKTDGVPLFVEEMTKMVLQSGLVKEKNGNYELLVPLPSLAVPSTLHDSLMARLDRLGTGKQVAQMGAALGREFTYEVLQAISPMDEVTLRHELSSLVDAELLYQRGVPPQAQYLFKHALIQEAAYQSLLRSTRQQYHRRIVQVIAEGFPEIAKTQPEFVAHHYTEAELYDEALGYWYKAGQQAFERSANLEAIDHVTKGLQLLTTVPATQERLQQELDFHMILASALTVTKGFAAPDVERTYARTRELCRQVGDTPQLFPVLWGLWLFYIARAEFKVASEVTSQYIHLAHALRDTMSRVDARYMSGVTAFYLGELVSAHKELECGIVRDAPSLQRAHASHYGYTPEVFGLSRMALVLWWLGYPDQALQRSREVLALAQLLPAPFSLALAVASAALVHLQRREGQAAQEQAQRAISLAEEHGFPHWLAQGKILQGCALVEQGEIEEGLTPLCQGITTYRAIGIRLGYAAYLIKLAEAYGRDGKVKEGLTVLEQAQKTIDTHSDRFYEAELYRIQGELLLSLGANHHEEATTAFHRALDVARHQQAKSLELRAAMSLSRLWEQNGRKGEARQLLADAYGWFREGFDTADLQEANALLEALSR